MNIIPAQLAREMRAVPGLDRYPYRAVNQYGADRIAEWLDGLGWPSGVSSVSAWMADAEAQPSDEVAVLEIPARASKSGRPETLDLDADCFDWRLDGQIPLAFYIHGHLLASGPATLNNILLYCREQTQATDAEIIGALHDMEGVKYDAEFDCYEIKEGDE